MKILFFGTPEIAKTCLQRLYEQRERHGFEIAGVVTQTDKPKGRGYELSEPETKKYASAQGLPVFQPRTLRDEDETAFLRTVEFDVACVVAYGKILPAWLLSLPSMGCINIHASLLPAYRGAAPIQRAIMAGETVTGVTSMRMDEGLDTGDMLLSRAVPISFEDNCLTLTEKLADAGADILIETLDKLKKGSLLPQKQNDENATYAAKIEKSELKLDFSMPANTLYNKIRGVYPALCTHAVLSCRDGSKKERTIKFARCAVSDDEGTTQGVLGEVVKTDAKNGEIHIRCAKGTLILKELIPEGKSNMSAADFIRGRQIEAGDRFI